LFLQPFRILSKRKRRKKRKKKEGGGAYIATLCDAARYEKRRKGEKGSAVQCRELTCAQYRQLEPFSPGRGKKGGGRKKKKGEKEGRAIPRGSLPAPLPI